MSGITNSILKQEFPFWVQVAYKQANNRLEAITAPQDRSAPEHARNVAKLTNELFRTHVGQNLPTGWKSMLTVDVNKMLNEQAEARAKIGERRPSSSPVTAPSHSIGAPSVRGKDLQAASQKLLEQRISLQNEQILLRAELTNKTLEKRNEDLRKQLDSLSGSSESFFSLKNVTIGTGVLALALAAISGFACKDDLTAQCVEGLPARLYSLFQ